MHLPLGGSSTELLRSQQLLMVLVKQQAVYISASSSNPQGCTACSLGVMFHP